MIGKVQFDEVDRAILALLTRRVRVATEEQLRSYVQSQFPSAPSLGRRLRRLQDAEVLAGERLVVAVLVLAKPLFVWPARNKPRFHVIAWRLWHRWTNAVAESHAVIWAGPKAVRLFGGTGGRLRQPLQVQHDLAVTAVFLRRSETHPGQASTWVSEDMLRQRHRKSPLRVIPDAAIVGNDGAIQTAIELGGIYPAAKLRRFHHHFRTTPYELW